jgi:hypothetical protein
MHANTFRRTPLDGGPLRPAVSVSDEPGHRVSGTSAMLMALAVLGVVVTFLFGMWMIEFVQKP